jgi:hypothetical protein
MFEQTPEEAQAAKERLLAKHPRKPGRPPKLLSELKEPRRITTEWKINFDTLPAERQQELRALEERAAELTFYMADIIRGVSCATALAYPATPGLTAVSTLLDPANLKNASTFPELDIAVSDRSAAR